MTSIAQYHALLRTDFHTFMTKVFQTLNPSTPFNDNWHLELLSHRLDQVRLGTNKRLIINVPPRSLKSLMTSIALPAFLLGHDPGARILCISHDNDLAIKFGRQCRMIMESDWYRQVFPATILSKNAEDLLETTAGGLRKAASIESGITGHGGMYIFIDDPQPASDATSKASRDKVIRLYRDMIYTRLDDKAQGRIVLVMQRLHEQDLAGFLIQQPNYEALVLRATATDDEVHDLGNNRSYRRQAGELLHPAQEPQEALDEARGLLSGASYSAQYQQEPVPEEGQKIKAEWIRRYDRKPDRDGMRIVISWDTAIKGTITADYSVATVWGERDGIHYLLDLYRKRVELPDLVADAAALYQRWQPNIVLVEAQGAGSSLIAYLRDQHGIHAKERRPQGDKITRFERATYYFEKGQVVFPRDAPWLPDIEGEYYHFPNGKHDDQVDSTSQYFDWVLERGHGGLIYHRLYDHNNEIPSAETLVDIWRRSEFIARY